MKRPMGRSCGDLANQATEQRAAANDWQMGRIQAGITDVRAGRTVPAEAVFDKIAAKLRSNRKNRRSPLSA